MEKSDMLKLIVKYLNNKGYGEVSSRLQQESNIYYEPKEFKNIKNFIKEGKLNEAMSLILNSFSEKQLIFIIPKIRVREIYEFILDNFDEDNQKNYKNQIKSL